MDTGILGGTFDPVHHGHVAIAREAQKRLGLERVIFVPARQPWLKVDREITPANHRVRMLEEVIADYPCFEISTIEIESGMPSYTVDTLRILQGQLGIEANLFFLMGWDSLAELPKWKEPARLVRMCRLVAFTRAKVELPDLEALEVAVPGISLSAILLDMPPVDISSSDIRERVAQKLPVDHMVTDKVQKYIAEHNLYRG